jgi:hypothetical protein
MTSETTNASGKTCIAVDPREGGVPQLPID